MHARMHARTHTLTNKQTYVTVFLRARRQCISPSREMLEKSQVHQLGI